MQRKIKNKDGEYVGLDPIVYSLKAPKKSDFDYSMKLDFIDENDDFFSIMKNIVWRIKNKKDQIV